MSDKAYDIGACTIFFKGPDDAAEVDLGDTSGCVKINLAQETQEIEVDQKLDPVDEIVTKRTITIDVPLAEYNLTNLQRAFPGSVIVTDSVTATKQKLVISSISGESMADFAGNLRLHPQSAEDADDVSKDWNFLLAAPSGNLDITYDKNNLKIVTVQFKAYPSQAAATLGQVAIFGDKTATAAAAPAGGD